VGRLWDVLISATYKLEERDKVVGQGLVHDELAIEVLDRAGGGGGHVDWLVLCGG